MKWSSEANVLPEEEQIILAAKAQQGDQQAANQLVMSNLKLASLIASKYKRFGLPQEDLQQEGFLGLIEAVSHFDATKGVKFSSYAAFWIKARILARIMSDKSLIRIGKNQQDRSLFFRLEKEKAKLLAQFGEVDSQKLADRLGMDVGHTEAMSQRLGHPDQSLDVQTTSEGEEARIEGLACTQATPEERVQQALDSHYVRAKMIAFEQRLDERDLLVWNKRIAASEPATDQEIGDVLELTRQRVNQIEIDLQDRFVRYVHSHA